MKTALLPIAVLSLALTFCLGSALAEKPMFITIGTGGITGVYYPTGGAIAKMVNIQKKKYGIRATVESTGGSVFNVNAVMSGDIEFGIVQSDRQFQAVNGLAEWKNMGPQEDLRAVFSIYPEAVTLVAASDAGIKNITDLRGKRVNIGNFGSGHRQNAIDALTAAGIDYNKDIKAESIKASDSAGLLQDNRIDAFFYTVGHPAGAIKEATTGARRVIIANITGIDSILEKFPYYSSASIPKNLYPDARNEKDAETFNVKATLITSIKVPDNIVYAITKEIFENLEDFKKLHPAYSSLTREAMLTHLSAPIHPGAMKYFKEEGLQ
ncbi:MAG TPA: TAXI family TRAP transporter solute-binding subunit [Desulfobacterales bacterium]|nr:TAXI family TRAP transporter solute-binding subunit [Desulfobacterales bacterium]